MKIAIIGSGISGMAAAHALAPFHDIRLFEAGATLGGHTATMDITHEGRDYAIDTGFIVFNDWTYPEFIRLMDSLGVESQPTRMSFSVSDRVSGIEYAGSNLDALFAQRRNLVSPRFLSMVKDILRFNAEAETHLEKDPSSAAITLGEYLERYRYSAAFRDLYLIPMGAAIWSSGSDAMMQFPLRFFVQFFSNHGLLNIRNRPQWRVIKGGSRNYIGPLTSGYADRIELANPIRRITRFTRADGSPGVRVASDRFTEDFDQVVLACHSDQALALLADVDPAEKQILSAIPYTKNSVVLHTDCRLLPRTRKCWSSWNVALDGNSYERPMLSYDMNILQGIESDTTFVVTLNQSGEIDEKTILGEYEYDHPVFTEEGLMAQQRWHEINGNNGTWFCGAYWRNGFHEDGVWSGLRVANGIRQLEETGHAYFRDEQKAELAESV